MKYNYIIFDLDGTLLDTLHDIALAMNSVLGARGFATHGEDDYRYFVGDGMAELGVETAELLIQWRENEALLASIKRTLGIR